MTEHHATGRFAHQLDCEGQRQGRSQHQRQAFPVFAARNDRGRTAGSGPLSYPQHGAESAPSVSCEAISIEKTAVPISMGMEAG